MELAAQISNLGVAGLAVFLMWKLVSNHLEHNTKALDRMIEIISKMNDTINSKL